MAADALLLVVVGYCSTESTLLVSSCSTAPPCRSLGASRSDDDDDNEERARIRVVAVGGEDVVSS